MCATLSGLAMQPTYIFCTRAAFQIWGVLKCVEGPEDQRLISFPPATDVEKTRPMKKNKTVQQRIAKDCFPKTAFFHLCVPVEGGKQIGGSRIQTLRNRVFSQSENRCCRSGKQDQHVVDHCELPH